MIHEHGNWQVGNTQSNSNMSVNSGTRPTEIAFTRNF